jgi:hypothetical protein
MPDGILDGMKMHPNPESQPSAHCLSLATAILKRETSNIQRRSEPRAVAIRLPTYPVGAAFETTCPAIPRHLIRTNPQSADLGLLRIRRMGVESLRAPLSTTPPSALQPSPPHYLYTIRGVAGGSPAKADILLATRRPRRVEPVLNTAAPATI